MFDDPRGRRAPDFDDIDRRVEFWEVLLNAVPLEDRSPSGSRSSTQHPTCGREMFRKGSEVLDHPQIAVERQVVEIDDAERGAVRQPGALVRHGHHAGAARPLGAPRSASTTDELRGRARAVARRRRHRGRTAPARARRRPPLEGMTVPRARHVLRGAVRRHAARRAGRAGDQDRAARRRPDAQHAPVPGDRRHQGAAGQGEHGGRRRHARGTRDRATISSAAADIVLQSFRAGVAERLGLDADRCAPSTRASST